MQNWIYRKRFCDRFEVIGKGIWKGRFGRCCLDRFPIPNTLWLLCCQMVNRSKAASACNFFINSSTSVLSFYLLLVAVCFLWKIGFCFDWNDCSIFFPCRRRYYFLLCCCNHFHGFIFFYVHGTICWTG